MPSFLFLRGDTVKSFVSIVFGLPGELLSGKFRLIFMKADGGSSVEVSSSAGSVLPSKVSVPISNRLKLKSRLDTTPVEASLSPFPA